MKNNKEYRLTFTDKAKEIVSKMSLDEKINIMAGKCGVKEIGDFALGRGYNYRPYPTGDCKKYNIPAMKFCDGPRGLVSYSATCFPVTMGRGATFDTELEERVGEAIGKEIRAAGGNYFGGVCINLPYNPGWGRSQEVYGEDSIHLGKMGVALTKGVQSQNVIACIKHYAFNSMELKRFDVSVKADKRTEREVYLRHFKQCIDEGAASVMGAYNKYKGKYCCHHDYLLKDVLKNEWGFDGFVISDFLFGVRNTVEGINGGLDIEMPITNYYMKSRVKKALNQGKVTQEQIDDACIRIVRTLLAFTNAKDPQTYPKSLLRCKEHVELAEEAARKSMTLIKNDNNVLPFSKSVKKIAVVGDLAKVENTGDHGSSWIKRSAADTIYGALEEKFGGKISFVATKEASAKKDIISSADAVILVAGMRHSDEGEYISNYTKIGGDRVKGLGLHADEIELIGKVCKYNKNTAIVLIGGNMLMLEPWFDNANAILMAYYPGTRGGHAVVDTLFGDNNPGGKTPFVTPFRESDLPNVDWNADEQAYEYYHGYRKLDKENKVPRIPYGFGLSYTQTELSDTKLESVNEKEAVFTVTVTNKGDSDGSEVPQLYIGFNGSAVHRPVRTLIDFNRVYLNVGESKTVTLKVLKSDLAYFDESINAFREEDIAYTAFIGTDEQKAKDCAIEFRFNMK